MPMPDARCGINRVAFVHDLDLLTAFLHQGHSLYYMQVLADSM